ncbi:electron transport complex protein RnfC [Aromatoleum tolulyticum]|uniref:Ion-translocating oxidoreductase complex subunit C n=1 Tax=Aromatoleum tolulyticum TaxID=34027 RepID=A0A1N6QFQ1_9RHOO|nr:electron transport complex subunit RsxC [Aromatoleum tolulyticum]SIQ15388.1 electron transport complex protein RnfC [Aromatoleum tolulyticum]
MGILDRFLRTARFSGGVHPDDHKRPAADAPLRVMPPPARLYVPLVQHIGSPARAVVAVGDHVRKGQRIGEPQGAVSAAIHAPTSGRVIAIGDIVAPHPSGLPVRGITIESDGRDEWCELEACDDPFALDPAEIGRRVARAGVVGLGGAAFPSAVKLSGGLGARVELLIINASECEPFLSCDDRLMRDRAAEAVDGIAIMLHATGAREARIGIEDNKPEAIAVMRAAVAGHARIRVEVIPTRYPMGSEKHLILVLTGREVPAEGRPSDIGVVVHNVGTAVAVRNAVRFGRPLVSRLVTVNGACVREPGNVEVPIGTLAGEVLAFCGGLRVDHGGPARLLLGGPMTGMQVPTLEVPVIKGTGGILVLDAAEVGEGDGGPCIRCGDCMRACPVGLLPLEIAARVRVGEVDKAAGFGLADCIACGCCAYVCPSRIPLVQYFHHAKGELAARTRGTQRNETIRTLTRAKAERLEREERDKAEALARRAAASLAAAAAAKQSAPVTEKVAEDANEESGVCA